MDNLRVVVVRWASPANLETGGEEEEAMDIAADAKEGEAHNIVCVCLLIINKNNRQRRWHKKEKKKGWEWRLDNHFQL